MTDHKEMLRRVTERLPAILPEFLAAQRWFGGKAHTISATEVLDAVPLDERASPAFVSVIRVKYLDAPAETYALPLKMISGVPESGEPAAVRPVPSLRLRCAGEDDLVLGDALWDRDFALLLLDSIHRRLTLKGLQGELVAAPTRAFERILGGNGASLEPSVMKREQSNTSVVYGDRLILKFFRRLQEGVNPDVEVGAFLTERTHFAHAPAVAGSLLYQRENQPPVSVAVAQAFVPNQGDAWSYTLGEVAAYFERTTLDPTRGAGAPTKRLLDLAREAVPPNAEHLIGRYLDSARLLGRRTAELHAALASDAGDANFAPEPFSLAWRRVLSDAMLEQAERTFLLLSRRLDHLAPPARELAERALRLRRSVQRLMNSVLGREIEVARIRIHGDYHLGQVLHTGGDFVIIDFEGEPARPISERRTKRLALQDVAGMLRSFHYAAETAVLSCAQERGASLEALRASARYWQSYVSAAFLQSYFSSASRVPFLPENREDTELLLDACLLQKAAYELEYELNNRPDWAGIPLQGILGIAAAP